MKKGKFHRKKRTPSNVSVSTSVSVSEMKQVDDGTQVEKASGGGKSAPTTRATKRNAEPNVTDTKEFKESLKAFCTAAMGVGVKGLFEEFAKLRAETQPIGSKPKTAFDGNTEKNRYKDVYCVDHSRVVLGWPANTTSDYIHANYVDSDKKIICTQGPKDTTIEDFWRMVWQEKAKSIIMLCNVMECGKKKCEQYWPEADSMKLECGLTISFQKLEELESHLTQTKLEVADEAGEKLTVMHIQWKDWPDRGVPTTTMSVFRLLTKIHKLKPTIVHCSAGIGRTGTVVGVDMLMQRLGKGEKVALEKIVRELRDSRHGSVQTDVQYLYMHRIMFAVAENKKVMTAAETAKFIEEYDGMIKAKGGTA